MAHGEARMGMGHLVLQAVAFFGTRRATLGVMLLPLRGALAAPDAAEPCPRVEERLVNCGVQTSTTVGVSVRLADSGTAARPSKARRDERRRLKHSSQPSSPTTHHNSPPTKPGRRRSSFLARRSSAAPAPPQHMAAKAAHADDARAELSRSAPPALGRESKASPRPPPPPMGLFAFLHPTGRGAPAEDERATSAGERTHSSLWARAQSATRAVSRLSRLRWAPSAGAASEASYSQSSCSTLVAVELSSKPRTPSSPSGFSPTAGRGASISGQRSQQRGKLAPLRDAVETCESV